MNNLKIKSQTGRVGVVKLQQSRNLETHPFHGEFWGSPAQQKARCLGLGATLLGKRQK